MWLMDSAGASTHKTEPTAGQVVEYYDDLADHYDRDRFGNSYGAYVDAQERLILRRWLAAVRQGKILDLACGTGRFLDLATHGLDPSEAMVRIARTKYPSKPIHCRPAVEVAQLGVQFDAIFCLHLFMHLPSVEIPNLFRVCQHQLQPGGLFIFDVLTGFRRTLTGFQPRGWHGATAMTPVEVRALAGTGWRRRAQRGVLFFPIHRLSERVRPAFRVVDDLIGMTPLNALSSYTVYCLEKKA
jgi:SAM-dependent methyltransferase